MEKPAVLLKKSFLSNYDGFIANTRCSNIGASCRKSGMQQGWTASQAFCNIISFNFWNWKKRHALCQFFLPKWSVGMLQFTRICLPTWRWMCLVAGVICSFDFARFSLKCFAATEVWLESNSKASTVLVRVRNLSMWKIPWLEWLDCPVLLLHQTALDRKVRSTETLG